MISKSQFATLKRGRSLKYAHYAFTEHGAAMVANVLNGPVAVHASIQVVRAFVRLREIASAHKDLLRWQILELALPFLQYKIAIECPMTYLHCIQREFNAVNHFAVAGKYGSRRSNCPAMVPA